MTKPLVRIATRKSPLALWQAEHVSARLEAHHPGLRCELCPIVTSGDRFLSAKLTEIGGKSMFVKELERALLDGSADIAVHSMKDVTAQVPEGLHLAAYTAREDPHDALVSAAAARLIDLPAGARVGTASSRRQCQLLAVRPDLEVGLVRGNVNTRLAKLDAGEFDALILAASGLMRLEFDARIAERIDVTTMLPAVGQGIMGVESRADDAAMSELLAPLNDRDAQTCILAERSMNAVLAGGCTAPMAGYATLSADAVWLRGLVGSLDGRQVLRAEARGPATSPELLGRQVAEQLLAQGADRLLDP
ncbi:MAG: hydroxymethylbilane synthase [Pseudomonadota bacterium]